MQHLHPSARLKILRESLHLSQRDLAKEFNVSSGAIASWELGSNPVPGSVIKLMDIYELKFDPDHKQQESLLKHFRQTLKMFPDNQEDLTVIETGIKTYLRDSTFLNQFQSKIKYAFTKKLVDFLNNGKGLAIKAAQLASYIEIGLPVEVRLALGNLQSTMKPMNKQLVQTILEKNYGCPVHEIFPVFDYHPKAVTSLAQVHYAKRKNGEEVAVKVQFNEIEKTLLNQFNKLKFLEKIGGIIENDSRIISQEIRRSILSECDYPLEAKNQEKARSLISQLPRTIVPIVNLDLIRPNVFVSEFIHAENFHSFCRKASQDSKNVVAESLLRSLTKLAFSHNFVMCDIHPENFLIKNDKVVFLDFGRIFTATQPRMKYETMFYRAMILNEKEKGRSFAKLAGFAKDEETFDFDEFWTFFRNASTHLTRNEKFKFTREYVSFLTREVRRFSHKRTLSLTTDAFWGFTFSAGTWALFAELEAECNWHQIALDTFNDALKA